MKKLAALWTAVALILAVAGYFAPLRPQQFGLYVGVEGTALVATIFLALRNKLAWWWVAALASFFLGDMTYVYFDLIVHNPRSFPNIGDVFYLAFYPLAVYALWRSSPHSRKETWVDAGLLALGISVPWWVFVEYPVLSAPGYNFIERAVSVAYPFGDIILVAMAIRLLFWKLPNSAVALVSSFFALAVTDWIYSIRQLDGSFVHGSWLDYGWFIFYFLWGLGFFMARREAVPLAPRKLGNSDTILVILGSILIPSVSLVIGLAIKQSTTGNTVGVLLLVVALAVISVLRIRSLASDPFALPDQKRAHESEERIKSIEKEIARLAARVDKPDK